MEQARNNFCLLSNKSEEQESASADRTQDRGSAKLSKRTAEQNEKENFEQMSRAKQVREKKY